MNRFITVTFKDDFIFNYENINQKDIFKIKMFFKKIEPALISCGFDLSTLRFELNNFKHRGKTKRINHRNEVFSYYYGSYQDIENDFITQYPLRQSLFISSKLFSFIESFFNKKIFIKESTYFSIKLKRITLLVDKSDCISEYKELVSLLEEANDFDSSNTFYYAVINDKIEVLPYLVKSEKIINNINCTEIKYDFLTQLHSFNIIPYLTFEDPEMLIKTITNIFNKRYNTEYKEKLINPLFKYKIINKLNIEDLNNIKKNIEPCYISLYNKYMIKIKLNAF